MQLDDSVGCVQDWCMRNQGLFPRGRNEFDPVWGPGLGLSVPAPRVVSGGASGIVKQNGWPSNIFTSANLALYVKCLETPDLEENFVILACIVKHAAQNKKQKWCASNIFKEHAFICLTAGWESLMSAIKKKQRTEKIAK